MTPEERPDYVEMLEKALFEYVEKFGPTDTVRRLFREGKNGEGVVRETRLEVGQGGSVKGTRLEAGRAVP